MTSSISGAKHPITSIPLASVSSIKQPNQVPALRCGAGDTSTTTVSLPEWTKSVKDPGMTLPQLEENFNTRFKKMTDSKPNPLTAMGTGLKMVPELYKLWRANKKIPDYLPKEAKQDLRRYHWTPGYWYNRLFNPQKAKMMDIVYQGPMVIKLKQARVMELTKNKKKLEDKLKEFNESKANFILKTLAKWHIKRQLKEAALYAPLLNNVPALPYKLFEKQL